MKQDSKQVDLDVFVPFAVNQALRCKVSQVRNLEMLKLIYERSGMTTFDIAKAYGITRQAVNIRIHRLRQAGVIKSTFVPSRCGYGKLCKYIINPNALVPWKSR